MTCRRLTSFVEYLVVGVATYSSGKLRVAAVRKLILAQRCYAVNRIILHSEYSEATTLAF